MNDSLQYVNPATGKPTRLRVDFSQEGAPLAALQEVRDSIKALVGDWENQHLRDQLRDTHAHLEQLSLPSPVLGYIPGIPDLELAPVDTVRVGDLVNIGGSWMHVRHTRDRPLGGSFALTGVIMRVSRDVFDDLQRLDDWSGPGNMPVPVARSWSTLVVPEDGSEPSWAEPAVPSQP